MNNKFNEFVQSKNVSEMGAMKIGNTQKYHIKANKPNVNFMEKRLSSMNNNQ